MIIKIDYRENNLIKIINDLIKNKYQTLSDITIINENLPIGDITITDKNNKEYVIFERKTLNDLSSSIKDGRYNEQSFRLNNCNIHNHNIIYLIEGDNDIYNLTKNSKYTPIKTLLSSIISIMYYKGFSLYKSKNLTETADFIICFADKIKREIENKEPYYKNNFLSNTENQSIENINIIEDNLTTSVSNNIDNENNKNDKEYINVIKRNKKDNITIDNIGEIMLLQIPNVSSQTAIAIMKRFTTIKNLIDNLERNVDLSDIYVGNRRISKTAISNIYKFLLQKDNDINIQI